MRVSRLFLVSLLLVLVAKQGTAGPRKRKESDATLPASVEGYSKANQSLPVNVFRRTLARETETLLLLPARLIGLDNQHKADFIAELLRGLRDPDQNVPPFGMVYSVMVWDGAIPAGFQDVIRTGGSPAQITLSANTEFIACCNINFRAPRDGQDGNPFYSEGRSTQQYKSIQGVAWTDKCSHKPRVNNIGVLGWPCPGGGVVALQANTSNAVEKNVIVSFMPNRIYRMWESKVEMLHLAKDACLIQQAETGSLVDLTLLSTCIYVNYPAGFEGKLISALQSKNLAKLRDRLKGIAVIPSFPGESAGIGVSSDNGGIIKVEEVWLGGSRLIFVAMPSQGV